MNINAEYFNGFISLLYSCEIDYKTPHPATVCDYHQ